MPDIRKPDRKPPVPPTPGIGSSESDDAANDMPERLPERKPAPPTVESDAEDYLANKLKEDNVLEYRDSLKADHPYGDGKHTESGHDTLRRIGADMAYGRYPKNSGL